jgi:transcriptional regulator with XRE-family HTH domain
VNNLESTARSRALGAELRRIRKDAGFGLTEVASQLGFSPSTISRLETGKPGTSEGYVIRLLATYRVTGNKFERLLELNRCASDRAWLQPRREEPSDECPLVLHETTAIKISEYDPLGIPDLLQTEDYAHALLRRAGLVPNKAADLRVQACLDRQSVFRQQSPPTFTYFVSEHVLRSSIGGTRVMNDQLLRLALESSRPSCTIRILPTLLGPSGLLGGPFRLMEYAEHLPVAHTQNHTTSLLLEHPTDIATYRTILSRLNEIALDTDHSHQLLLRLADGFDTPEERGYGSV